MEGVTYLVANYNNGKYIADCLESLASQSHDNWLCLIADDHSDDDSVDRVLPFLGSKVRLVRHEKNLGYIETLKGLIDSATTDIVAILDPDDALNPSATEALLSRYAQDPGTGFVYSKFEVLEEDLKTPIDVRGREIPPASTSLCAGHIGHILSFRISAYRRTAGLDPAMLFAEDRDLVYKLEEVTRPSFIDQVLYRYRRVPGSQSTDPVKKETGLRNHFRAQMEAMRRREITGIASLFYRAHFLALYLTRSDRFPHTLNGMIAVLTRLLDVADRWLLIRSPGRLRRQAGDKGFCYYLWRYPVLSETFVQREIAALTDLGARMSVFADRPGSSAAEVNDRSTDADYLFPLDQGRFLKYLTRFLLRQPVVLVRKLVQVCSCEYVADTSLSSDIRLFGKAVYLAGTLQDLGMEHAHSPWASENAFVLRIVAELAKIPYSVQARAQDIYRDHYRHGLQHRLGAAQFIVTNAEFNQRFLCSVLDEKSRPEIHLIYEGLDLSKFPSTPRSQEEGGAPLRVLCVGRLIECKGFLTLLDACRILQENGVDFQCRIIGGPEEPLYTDHYDRLLEKHRELGLEAAVTLCGEQPLATVLDAYRSADLFVLPCRVGEDGTRDVTPNVLMEAMAFGLPVVSTDMTAIPEIVEDRVSGRLVPPGDPVALADTIMELNGDPALRLRLGAAAQRRVAQRFDIRRNIRAYAALFGRAEEASKKESEDIQLYKNR